MRMGDLELIRVYELRDERDERVSILESAAAVLEEWRPFVDGTLDDIRLDLRRLKEQWDRSPLVPSSVPPGMVISPVNESTAARPSAVGIEVDWPDGHRSAPSARERGAGSMTTQVPNPNNGTLQVLPPMQFNSCLQPYNPVNRPPNPPPQPPIPPSTYYCAPTHPPEPPPLPIPPHPPYIPPNQQFHYQSSYFHPPVHP
jgi:hypothetical protein